MKYSTLASSALTAFAVFSAVQARADNMASIAITPATGAVTLVPQWSIGGNLAGFHQMPQDLGLTGSVANNFYSITAATIPAGGNTLAFNFYVPASGSATPHSDIGSKLTPHSYSALTSADPDVGYGSVNLYLIHHKGTTDYFSAIIPGSASASAVTDEKPMSGPGGPGTVTGVHGYFGLTFAAANLGYGLNNFYYLRNVTKAGVTSTKFGTLAPALLGSSADQFDVGNGGYKALAFTGTDVGYGVNKMYYIRLDPVTGYSILGMLDPALAGTRHTSDIANLGSVYSTLTFVPGDIGFGVGQFYTTGAVKTTWQSVSFAAIADRKISDGAFNVNPTASSGLAIRLTIAPGSVGAASIVNAGGGVFTITPTAPGLITLQATQAGRAAPAAPVYEYNMLRQSFTINAVAINPVTIQAPIVPIDLTGGAGAPPAGTIYTATGLPAGLVLDPSTGLVSGTATKPGSYKVTYGTITTDINGHKTYGPKLTVVIVVAPLSSNLSGKFETILEVPPAPGVPVGKVELLVNANTGSFTGKLTAATDARTYAFMGKLTLNTTYDAGVASVTINRGSGHDPYRLDLALDSTLAADQVFIATLRQLNGSNVEVATLGESDTGVQLATYTAASPAPWQGSYSLILDDPTAPPANLGMIAAPEGTGYGMVTIRAVGGLLVCRGRLGDGTPLTASVSPSADGSYRLFVKPYGTGGSFAGWVRLVPVTGLVAPYQITGAANSELYWSKNPSTAHDKSYRAGFGPVAITATAQRWIAPARGTSLSTVLMLPASLMDASFASIDLPVADLPLVPTAVGLDNTSKFVVTAPVSNSDNFTMKAQTFNGSISTATGLFTGNLTLQDSRHVAVTGVLMQQPSVVSGTVIGEGFFIIPPALAGGESVSGKVQFTAP